MPRGPCFGTALVGRERGRGASEQTEGTEGLCLGPWAATFAERGKKEETNAIDAIGLGGGYVVTGGDRVPPPQLQEVEIFFWQKRPTPS